MHVVRDHDRGDRWCAVDDGTEVASATVWTRPDRRTFVSLDGDIAAIRALVEHTAGTTGGAVHTFVDEADAARRRALEDAGFEVEMIEDVFTVPFDRAIRAFAKAPTPVGYSIVSADDPAVDRDRLVELDNLIRQDVPGCDGWRADRAWIDAELADRPPFDPDSYLVGVRDADGEYAGLIRIWRNTDGPRFGLVGVTRPHRHTTLAAALLRRALTAASGWGSATFTCETSPDNPVIHRRMARFGANRTRRLHQMVRVAS